MNCIRIFKALSFYFALAILSTPLYADFIITEKGEVGDLRWWSNQAVISENNLYVLGHVDSSPGQTDYKLYTINTVTDEQSSLILKWEDDSPVKQSLNMPGFYNQALLFVHWLEPDYYAAGKSAEVVGILDPSTGIVTRWQADPPPAFDAVPDEKTGIIADLKSFYANGSGVIAGNRFYKQGVDQDTTSKLYILNTETRITESSPAAGIYSFITGFDSPGNKIHVVWPDAAIYKYGKMSPDGTVETLGDVTALKTYRKALQNDAVILISGLDNSDQKKLYEYDTLTGDIVSSPFIDQSRHYDLFGVNDNGEKITLWWDAGTQTEKYGIISNNATISLSGTTIVSESVGTVTITATLANTSSEAITVKLAYNHTGNDSAIYGSDYTGPASPEILIPSGSLSSTLDLSITDDNNYEPGGGEVITVSVTKVVNGEEDGDQYVSIKITEEDLDGDDMADDWEGENDSGDPGEDADNDGISNLDEFKHNSDPNNPDTDNDGLSDAEEINLTGTDPTSPDTDDDGYSDKTEVLHGSDPLTPDTEAPAKLILYVSQTAIGTGIGLNWENAFTKLHEALDLEPWLLAGDQIWVAAGTYYPDTDGLEDPRSASFRMLNGIEILGGFIGVEVAPEDRVPEFNLTILSGDIGVPDDMTDNCYHIFYLSGDTAVDETAVLDGFIISGGNAGGTGEMGFGGGMFIKESSPTIAHCLFRENKALISGGGIHGTMSDLSITNTIFEGNISGKKGGAINLFGAAATIQNSLFFNNRSEDDGGALKSEESVITITGSTLTQNSAGDMGGAVHTHTSDITISGSILWNNLPEEIVGTSGTTMVTYSVVTDGYEGEGNSDADPEFSDPENLDFTLKVGSGCIGAGNPEATEESSGETDLAGNPRISCLTIDMGAFELPEPVCSGQSAVQSGSSGGGGGCFIETASGFITDKIDLFNRFLKNRMENRRNKQGE